jgi:serine/threonine protein kinase
MTAETWAQISELFEQCLAKPAEARLLWLAASAADAEVVAEVEKLIVQESAAGEFLEDSPEAVRDLHAPPAARFAPGDRLADRYTILRPLGRGGMGQVYAAFDEETQTEVALKVAHPGAQSDIPSDTGFRRELRFGRQVTHPHVCRLFDLGRHPAPEGPVALLTMELVEGETLAARLRRMGPLSVDEARPLAEQLLSALAAIHQAGLVHCDLKPSNIMLLPGRAVIMDFGLADRNDHRTEKIIGTLDYMAPEQLRGDPVTFRADLYSMGIVLHEMVTGGRPSPGLDASLPLNWSLTIRACLAQDPMNRPAIASQVLELLADPIPSPRTSIRRTHRPRPRTQSPAFRTAIGLRL